MDERRPGRHNRPVLRLQPLQTAHLDLVAGWLGQPHVARWYTAGSSPAAELAECRRALSDSDPTTVLLIGETGPGSGRPGEPPRPIGWCQWYECRSYPDWATAIGAEQADIGIDYAIGEPDRIGRGLGTALISALVARVRVRHPAAGFVADPDARNLGSRRVLEKNGFQLLAVHPVSGEATADPMAIYRLPPR